MINAIQNMVNRHAQYNTNNGSTSPHKVTLNTMHAHITAIIHIITVWTTTTFIHQLPLMTLRLLRHWLYKCEPEIWTKKVKIT